MEAFFGQLNGLGAYGSVDMKRCATICSLPIQLEVHPCCIPFPPSAMLVTLDN